MTLARGTTRRVKMLVSVTCIDASANSPMLCLHVSIVLRLLPFPDATPTCSYVPLLLLAAAADDDVDDSPARDDCRWLAENPKGAVAVAAINALTTLIKNRQFNRTHLILIK